MGKPSNTEWFDNYARDVGPIGQVQSFLATSHDEDGTLLPAAVSNAIGGSSPFLLPATAKGVAGNYRAMRAFRAAIGNRADAACNVVCLGDSQTSGYGAATPAEDVNDVSQFGRAFPARLADLLRSRFPTAGETALAPGPNFAPVLDASGAVATGWTISGTTSIVNFYGPLAYSSKATASGVTWTYTVPAGVTSIDVLCLSGASIGGLTVAVDGGSASSTFGNSGTNRDGFAHRVTLDSSSSHSIVVTTVSTTQTYLHGILMYAGNEDAGIRVINGGHHGSRAVQYSQISGSGNFSWFNPATVSPTVLSGLQSLLAFPPDLVVMNWGTNEWTGTTSNTAAEMKTAILSIIAGIRAVFPSRPISFLLWSSWQPNTTVTSTDTVWADYAAAKQAIADADDDVAHFDFSKIVPNPGTTDATNLALYFDTKHAAAKGYNWLANELAFFAAPS